MKLLVLSVNYGDSQAEQYARQVEEFKKYENIEVEIVTLCTDPSHAVGRRAVYSKELGYAFHYKSREWLKAHINSESCDFILCSDNDIRFPESSVLAFIDHWNMLQSASSNFIPQFALYENREGRYTSWHHAHSCHRGGQGRSGAIEKVIEINGVRYFSPWNIHAASWCLSKKKVCELIDSGRWQTSPYNLGRIYSGERESSATEHLLYFDVWVPYDCESVAIEHMNIKYDGLTREQLLSELATFG